jgi:hypothetical protein
MSLYIKAENQTYLWSTIHSHPKFIPHLKQYPPEKISAWFRSTIGGFYRQWGEKRPINAAELKQLNQNTVTYLYQSITSLNSPAPTPQQQQSPQPPHQQPHPQPIQTAIQQQTFQSFQQQQQPIHPPPQQQPHPSMPKPLAEFHGQHEFEQRSQEYQMMNSKPAAAPIQGQTDADQRESQESMERKWMEQQRLREKDIEHFSPPSQVTGPQAINLNLLKSTGQLGVIPQQETESIQMKIREIVESKGSIPSTKTNPMEMGELKKQEQEEPEWSMRIKQIEQTQETMSKQIEQIFKHILSITEKKHEKMEPEKMTDIDE